MGFYIDHLSGIYYEGDRRNHQDAEVSQRPSLYHKPAGALWELDREARLYGEIRPERNRLLDETDLKYCNAERWDSMTITLKEAWSSYKQALRDLPDTIDYDNPVWPVMPV
ncbi:MAG: phage tail assembly chaperone [Syntrophorhabdus sp.]